jgi:hypothetical protein
MKERIYLMTEQYEIILETIDNLTEEEVKAFLKQVYARMDIVENGNGEYTSEKCIADILFKFKEIPRVKRKLE